MAFDVWQGAIALNVGAFQLPLHLGTELAAANSGFIVSEVRQALPGGSSVSCGRAVDKPCTVA